MSTSTGQARTRVALAVIFMVGVIGSLIWTAKEIRNLRRDQAEQGQRIQQTTAEPLMTGSVKPEAGPAAAPEATPGAPPPNWSEQLAEIRNETRAEIAKLQEQIRKRDPAAAELATLREENRAELTRLREEITQAEQAGAQPKSRDRQEELLRSLRDQVRALDRRTAVLASAVRGTRAARAARATARRKRLAVRPVSRNRNVTVVYPSGR